MVHAGVVVLAVALSVGIMLALVDNGFVLAVIWSALIQMMLVDTAVIVDQCIAVAQQCGSRV